MNRDATGPALSAIFVDYDNIYMALKKRSEEAAKRFSKDAALWLKELESGRLITSTSGFTPIGQRRIVMNRCYGNPMPRRNQADNSTDMSSFPFVRHHYLRAGSEVIDCPPLTAQLKNSADIRIVMDVRDMISHDTYFDEFIILSGDADFTPLLHRLRAHARRTVIYANDHTAQPYTAISDGEVRESDLLRLLLEGSLTQSQLTTDAGQPQALRPVIDVTELRREIIGEIVTLVRQAGQPVPLEALADRLVRQLGHEKTAGSGWGGTGGFRDLLTANLPEEFRLSGQAPFVVFEVARMLPVEPLQRPQQTLRPEPALRQEPVQRPETTLRSEPTLRAEPQRLDRTPPAVQRTLTPAPAAQPAAPIQPLAERTPMPALQSPSAPRLEPSLPPDLTPGRPQLSAQPVSQPPAAQRTQVGAQAMAIQQAVARIYEACQAPPLSPPEYRAVFEIMAAEITSRGLTGAPTLDNIVTRAKELGIEIRRDDVRFLLDVVSESDPWFEQGAAPNLFASRFRNFVVARCRSHGLALTADELDLIEHWFAGSASLAPPAAQPAPPQRALSASPVQQPAVAAPTAQNAPQADRWWSMDAPQGSDPLGPTTPGTDDFPRIIRSRMRG